MTEYVFTYDGIPSTDYHVYAFPDNSNLDPPERNVETVEIPGRNGDLTIDKGNFKNRTVVIKCICDDYRRCYPEFREWMLYTQDYRRLEDARTPDTYMMARCSDVKLNKVAGHSAVIELDFTCKPQKFLKLGEIPVEFTSSGTIYNPTKFSSKPLLRITGTGLLSIAGQEIQINKNAAGMTIDTEIMEAYNGNTWLNGDVVLPEEFSIPAGQNTFTLPSGITKLVITPRWWTI